MLCVRAFYGIPKSATKKKRADIAAGLVRPTKKPDFDNVFKILCDALNGVAYADDAQIVQASIHKCYTPCMPHVEVSIHAFQGDRCGI